MHPSKTAQASSASAGVILFYHGVIPRPSDAYVERFLLAQDEFKRHLDYFSEHFSIVSLSQLLEDPGREGERPRMVLTFDDALRCFYDYAVPLLEERRLPYVVCVPSGLIGQAKPLWSLELAQLILLSNRPSIEVDLAGRRRQVRLGSERRRATITEALHFKLLQMADAERDQVLASLRCNFTAEELEDLTAGSPALGTVDVERLLASDASLVEFAVHGQRHIPLHDRESDEVLRRETRTARTELERALDREAPYFCFPYGTCSDRAMEALEHSGYRAVLGTEPQAYTPDELDGPPILLPRICGERPLEDIIADHARGWSAPTAITRPRWLTFPARAIRRIRRGLSPI